MVELLKSLIEIEKIVSLIFTLKLLDALIEIIKHIH